VTTNLEQGDIDSVCKCCFNYIRQVAAAFGVDPQSRTGLIFILFLLSSRYPVSVIDGLFNRA